MFRLSIVSTVIVVSLAIAAPATAACGARPETPPIPNGGSAQIEDMKVASKAVETFSDSMDGYADCLIDSAQTAIDDRNSSVRLAACQALMALGDKSEEVVEGIASCLTSSDRDVRRMAATALKGDGEHLKPTLPNVPRIITS